MCAFAPAANNVRTGLTQANLFGGAEKGEGGETKQPGMLDQLAMFKKAQEIAGKKKEIEKELSSMEFKGTGADDKVTVSMQYVASKNPMDPQPDFVVSGVDFDDEYFESASAEDLSAAVLEAYQSSVVETKKTTEEKFAVLAEDLKDVWPMVRIAWARASPSFRVFMKAPVPTLQSSTRASMPSTSSERPIGK